MQIKWERRWEGSNKNPYVVSVDKKDCPGHEPTLFDPKWFSHKFKGPGARYEVAVCIATANIVWADGPFPCGAYLDLKIFRLGLLHALREDETVVADGGYQDSRCVTRTGLNNA